MGDLVPNNVNVPAHIADLMGKGSGLASSLSGGIGFDGESIPRISLKGARFRIKEDGEEIVLDENKIDVTIVGANPGLSKNFYDKAWDPDAEPEAPACFSWNGVRPHPDAEKPQSDLCSTCPHNAWGSKISPSGVELKACPDSKRLAIVSSDDPEGTVYLLTVTASVLKSLKAYSKELEMRGWPVQAVRTQLSFDTDASYPKLQMKFNGFLDEDAIKTVMDRVDSDEVVTVTASNQPETPVPSSKPADAPVSVEPEKEPEVEAEEEPAPKKATGFGAKKKKEEAESEAKSKGFGAKKKEAAPEGDPPKDTAKTKAVVAENKDDLMAEIENLVKGAADDE